MDAQPGDHPPGRLREELRARGDNKYTFRVHAARTRRRCARRSRQLFGVRVVDVRTVSVKPKPKRRGSRRAHAQWKKAIVKLQTGDTIQLFEGLGARGVAWPIRKHKPTTPGRRFVDLPHYEAVTKNEPEKSLVEGLTKSGGRNAHGRMTSRHRGGGAKRLYRKIDFKRRKDGVPAKVAAIEYDPNRSAYIALLHYADGEKRYILAPARLTVGDGRPARTRTSRVGNCLPLANIPTGTVVHNVELAARPRRPARPLRGHGDPADGEGGATWPRCACPPARCAWCARSAARPSARSATPTTRTSTSARPAASATWACARRRAAPR